MLRYCEFRIRLIRQELNPRPKARYFHFYTIWLFSAVSKIISVYLLDLMKMLTLAKTQNQADHS